MTTPLEATDTEYVEVDQTTVVAGDPIVVVPDDTDDRFSSDNSVELSDDRASRLRKFNLIMGALHAASGVAMVTLENDFSLSVSALNLNGPPGTPLSDGSLGEVWSVQLKWLTASFAFLSAFFHLLIGTVAYSAYIRELRRGQNRFRWVEYALSSTLMMVLIAMITNLTDLGALIGLAFANVAMILFGWIMEVVNPPEKRVWWTPFTFGSIAGIGPWVAILAYIGYGFTVDGAEQPPAFVWGIIASIFVFFNSFAINQWLQYAKIGKWRDYIVGEVTYIALSLVAKTALAWQIFANTLIDQ